MSTTNTPSVDRQAYMELYDPGRNQDKFYQITRTGKWVWCQWGRCGTKGQWKRESFAADWRADEMFSVKLAEKRRKGYALKSGSVPLPDDAQPNATSTAQAAEPATPPSESDSGLDSANSLFLLSWKAEEAITQHDLETAAELTNRILDYSQHLQEPRFRLVSGEDWRQVTFTEDGEQVASFGFPPKDFLDKLSSREYRAVMELGVSRDGWLSNNGTGAGIIITSRKWMDFPIRLFLSILQVNCGLEVSDSDNTEYSQSGLLVTPAHAGFAWYPAWKDGLQQAVEELWFVRGSSRVVFSAPLEEEGRNYAW